MRDDFLSRGWVDNRHHLSDGIRALARRWIRDIQIALDRVHAYEFDSPWHRVPPPQNDQSN